MGRKSTPTPIPYDGGISRYELDTLQYLKQREIRHQATRERSRSLGTQLAGFAGGLVGSATDPINIASAFIPIVREARYLSWLSQASGAAGRAFVRIGVGALEGAAGTALIEPIVYFGAQSEQFDYGLADSFLNVMFGTVLGGGLHVAAGGVYDYRGAKVGRGVDALIAGMRRHDAADAPESAHLAALQTAVRSLEDDAPVHVEAAFDARAAEAPDGPLARDAQTPSLASRDEDALAAAREAFEREGGKVGAFGPIHEGLSGNYAEAVRRLSADQDGEAPGVLSHTDVGPIDLVWGWAGTRAGDGAGLAKIVRHHPEVVDDLPNIIAGMTVQTKSANRIRLESADHQAVVRLDYDGAQKSWLLTAYERGAPLRPADDGQAGPRGRTDTAPPTQGTSDIEQRTLLDNEDAAQASRSADEAVNTPEITPDDLESNIAQADSHIESMRERGLLNETDETELKQADEAAKDLEARASAYEAAAACEMES